VVIALVREWIEHRNARQELLDQGEVGGEVGGDSRPGDGIGSVLARYESCSAEDRYGMSPGQHNNLLD
jgi:hypothetical protein